MNQIVLLLVLVLAIRPSDRGRGRERGRRRMGSSWSPLSFFSRMHWDHEPAWEIQSAAAAAHSKTWRKFGRLWPTRQLLEVRWCSTAFDGRVDSEFVRFMETLLSFFSHALEP